MSKWKKQIDQYRKVNFASFVSAGTVIGHYLVDEPPCSGCWGGTKIAYSEIEEMARYSKSIWPSMPTGVRSSPSQLGGARFKSLRLCVGAWGGPLHTPAFKMSPEQFRDTQIAAAKKLGLGLVFGLNYLDGGDGTSRINGTYAKDPNLKDNKSTASPRGLLPLRDGRGGGQEGRDGLRQASYACAVISWKYDATFRNRSGMKDAIAARRHARQRAGVEDLLQGLNGHPRSRATETARPCASPFSYPGPSVTARQRHIRLGPDLRSRRDRIGLTISLLGAKGRLEAVERPAVVRVADEVLPVAPLGFLGRPAGEEQGAEGLPERQIPVRRLAVGQLVLERDSLFSAASAASRLPRCAAMSAVKCFSAIASTALAELSPRDQSGARAAPLAATLSRSVAALSYCPLAAKARPRA